MTGVISSQGVVSEFLLTVHAARSRPSCRWSEHCVGGPRGSPPCLRVPRGPRAKRKRTAGGRALLMMPGGSGEAERCHPRRLITPEASPQGSGEIEFAVRALSG
jgi:hypothetical protein